MDIHIGIDTRGREAIAAGLSKVLADTYTLYLMTHNFHWNVTGHMFQPLHEIFEEQYRELGEAVDDIAERIRALGHFAPATYGEFKRLTSIEEPEGVPSADEMIRRLVESHEKIVSTARTAMSLVEENDDQVSADLLVHRMQTHEKRAWMLRSFLEDSGGDSATRSSSRSKHRRADAE